MERLIEKIIGWLQMIFATFLVAVAAFNFWRALSDWHNMGIVVMFTALLAVSIALLVLSVRDYAKLKEDKELENIKSKN